MNRILFLLSIVLFCNTGIFAQDNTSPVTQLLQQIESIKKSAIGKEFCDFESDALDGKVISKKDLKGKITFINLWFETCSPCIAEMGNLIELYSKLKDNKDFQFFSFTIDAFEIAKKAVEKYNIPYIVCPVSREDAYRMNLNTGFPTKIILDKEGKIVFFNSGSINEIEGLIKQML